MTKRSARRLLGIPEESTVVVMGAINLQDKWKGGPLLVDICNLLRDRTDISLVTFGRSSEKLPAAKSFGLVSDERMMPLILNSADIFVGTAIEEAFGQTLLEASACGIPVVAFDVGGVCDVVVNEQTGLLVKNKTVEDLFRSLDRLLADKDLRRRLGENGRKRVENSFYSCPSGESMGRLSSRYVRCVHLSRSRALNAGATTRLVCWVA